MPLIKPRTRGKQILRHIARLDRENNETLHAYAAFLGESTDYVLNQVIDTVLARDIPGLGKQLLDSQTLLYFGSMTGNGEGLSLPEKGSGLM